ncbi:MAG: type II secretion system major pseudopilin GspG [Pseudomonadota bacterium]
MDRETEQQKPYKDAGFSLTELMIVVFIMGLLATMIIVSTGGIFGQSRDAKARADIQRLDSALQLYNLDIGVYPSANQGLRALVEMPSGVNEVRYRGGGYVSKLELDPWGNPYQYEAPGRRSGKAYDLFSFGADGTEGGEDDNADVGNWQSDAELEGY